MNKSQRNYINPTDGVLPFLNETLIDKENQSELIQESFSLKTQSKNGNDISLCKKLLELQGQCRIKQISYLKINYLKAIVLIFLMSISVIGLLLLKYFKKLQAFAFFDKVQQSNKDLTHIYIRGQQGTQQISKIQRVCYQNKILLIFQFKRLKYQLIQNSWLPLGLNYAKDFMCYKSSDYINNGLSLIKVKENMKVYGLNEHKVEVPTYPQYLFETMTQPFFLFQYIMVSTFFFQNLFVFGATLLAFAFITTTINYILLWRSYRKIKQTAQKLFKVKVIREGKRLQITNIQLVPGDIYIPSEQIPCDSLILSGDLFVDEVDLTGQNIPIPKFAVIDLQSIHDKCHWVFEGSRLETMRQHSLAMVVNVGYGSQRGRIIRKILTKVAKQPEFFKKIIFFQTQIVIIACILYIVSLMRMQNFDIDLPIKIIRFFQFIPYAFPPAFPIFFNLAYSFALIRLNRIGVVGTQAEKTVQGSRIKTMCFDKTGTLTQNKMEVCKVYHIQSHNQIKQVTHRTRQIALIANCLASCNSVQLIDSQMRGDEIDLRLFQFVKGKLSESYQHQYNGVLREIRVYGRTLQILRINQYQPQFQSMSVLIRDADSKRYYIYVKGNPEMIHKYSDLKYHKFEECIKRLSLSGFRIIGFGYKQVDFNDIDKYLNAEREQFLKNIIISGIVTFINKLKDDAKSTLVTLSEANINTKIITGDNIYLGIQTAFATGMIDQNKKVIVVEGSKYNKTDNSVEVLQLRRTQNGEITEQRKRVNNFSYSSNSNEVYAIDNDFILERPQQFLSDKVKVFARISPENKALIVRKHKERELQIVNSRKGLKSLFGDCSFKVGMVGDGANDLIAIKQADLGIGISSSDAIYSASFAVQDLSQIIDIVLESKNTERQIIQMVRFYGISQFLSIVILLLLEQDCSYFTSAQLTFKNFAITVPITFFFCLSKPAIELTNKMPDTSFLNLRNHLLHWSYILVASTGFVISYIYYSSTDDFIPNNVHRYAHFPQGWFGNTKSSTINFISSNLFYSVMPIIIYKGKPWKQPLWANLILCIWIAADIVILLVVSLSTENLSVVKIQPIGIKEVGVVILIMLFTCVICYFLDFIIQKVFSSNQRIQYEKNQQDLFRSEIYPN